ncbi:MAG: 50S ribosomal protein L5 [Candidatus Kerfeldbacteria bacterium]|nr:50S ribosomal protein L5 [Candidatus Kerfeldbacteria bacterium]
MNILHEKFVKEIAPSLRTALKVKNIHEVPRLVKIVLNVGAGAAVTEKTALETVQHTLERITGQKPVLTLAKKSISNFKIRQGMPIGAKVTLRGERMYDFFQKLIQVTFPRVRDFRGISKSVVDPHGNITIGMKEHTVFPEIRSDEIDRLHGLEVTIVTTARDKQTAEKLLEAFGFPFHKGKVDDLGSMMDMSPSKGAAKKAKAQKTR